MKKSIVFIITLIFFFNPAFALDLITMENGATHLGTLLTIDSKDKVMIQMQDGATKELEYADIRSIQKIGTESTGQQAAEASQILLLSTQDGAIGGNIIIGRSLSMQDNPNFIQYIPGTKGGFFNFDYEPPKAIAKGMIYNIETYAGWPSEIKEFFHVIRSSVPNLDASIEKAIQEIERKIQTKRNTFFTGLILGGGGLVAAVIPLMNENFPHEGMGLYIGGLASTIVGEIIMLTQYKGNESEVKNLIVLYNQKYAR